jgi:hypothetical protein
MKGHEVLEVLTDLFVRHGPPEHLRSDNGPEFTAKSEAQGPLSQTRSGSAFHPSPGPVSGGSAIKK